MHRIQEDEALREQQQQERRRLSISSVNVHSAREYIIEIEGLKKQIEDRNDECSELGKRMNDFRSSMNEQLVKASERVKERENVLL